MQLSRAMSVLRFCSRHGCLLQLSQPTNSILAACSAHFWRRLKAAAEGWSLRLSEDATAVVFTKLNTSDTSRFSVRHSRYGARNRWSNATGSAVVTTFHGIPLVDNRLALRHAGYRAGDRGRRAAGAAIGAAGEGRRADHWWSRQWRWQGQRQYNGLQDDRRRPRTSSSIGTAAGPSSSTASGTVMP